LRYYFIIQDSALPNISNDFPKIRNLSQIFLRSFENVAPVYSTDEMSTSVGAREQMLSSWKKPILAHHSFCITVRAGEL